MSAPDTLPDARNEAFEIKQIEAAIAASCAAFMHQIGGRVDWYRNAWEEDVYRHFVNTDQWRDDDQTMYFHHDTNDHRKSEYVEFTKPYYTADSDFIEGTPKLLQDVELRVDGLSKTFDNTGGSDIVHVAYTEEVAVENKVANSLRQAFTFDLTVSSETTVSGEYPGASLEQKLSTEVHTGFERETETDTEETHTDSDSVAIEFDVGADKAKGLNVNKKHQLEEIPVKGLFVVDFEKISMKLRHWWADRDGNRFRKSGQDYLDVPGVEGIWQLLQGTDTHHPSFEGFWNSHACSPRVRAGIYHLLAVKNRSYYLDITKRRTIESNVTYKPYDVDPARPKGPVVDLSDEENRAKYTNG